MTDAAPELKSRRYVTGGYRNVFHRSFLYGLGLSQDDMRKPFAGLAIAHNEAVGGQGLVRGLADLAKRGLTSAGITEREFVVPETSGTGRDAVTSRELVADSAELVVRGHWYDALVGVAATPSAVAGIVEAIARLRIPGLVIVPAERCAVDPGLARLVSILDELGLGLAVLSDETAALQMSLERVSEQILGEASVVSVRGKLTAGAAALGGLASSTSLIHVCALAHELGVLSALDLVDRSGADNVALRQVEIIADDHRMIALADVDRAGASGRVLRDGQRVFLEIDGTRPEVRPCQEVAQAASDSLVVVGVGVDTSQLVDGAEVRLAVLAERGQETGSDAFPVAAIAAVTHPGPVDSALNYDRL